jgi:hypothetical protein
MKQSIALALAILLSSLCGPSLSTSRSGEARAAKREEVPCKPAAETSVQIILSQRLEIPPEFKGIKFPVKTTLRYLQDVLMSRGFELRLMIDHRSFVDSHPNSNQFELAEVGFEFPEFVRSMTCRQYLDLVVKQLPVDACVHVSGGVLVVTTPDAVKLDRLLDRKIAIDLRKKTVVEAFEEVSALSGVSIVVDPRCNDGQKSDVMLRTNNDMSVRGILESIADIHDLKLVADSHRVTVLPRAVYLKRLRDQAEEAAALRELKK